MKRKVIDEWKPLVNKDFYILTLDEIIALSEANYTSYQIDGVIYKPISISNSIKGIKCIALEGKGGFVGKEVEFI